MSKKAVNGHGHARPHVLIIGGGVIGISTAIALLDHPVQSYDVTIVAPDLPSFDRHAYRPFPTRGTSALPSYASAWAGAHHVSDAKTDIQRRRDRVTFDVLVKLERAFARQPWCTSDNKALLYVHQTEYWSHLAELDEACVDWYPQYKRMPADKLLENIDFGATFKTLDLDIPRYLPLLYTYFLQKGGRAIQHRAKSIEEAIELAQDPKVHSLVTLLDGRLDSTTARHSRKPDVVVASPGLGAKELLGDEDVMPVRGQTVLVRAPWCTTEKVHGAEVANEFGTQTAYCGMSKVIAARGGYRDTYIIPRGDGLFICGGTRLDDDWDGKPRKDTTKDIIRRCLTLMPQLQRPDGAESTKDVAVHEHNDDGEYKVDIVDVNVGLRPARRTGIRLGRAPSSAEVQGIPMVYNYGFGGIGYQSSWGAAFDARQLVDEALERQVAAADATLAALDDGTITFVDPASLVV